MKREKIKYEYNQHGIKVNRSCQSCVHKGYRPNGTRYCKKTGEDTDVRYDCRYWEMSEGLQNAGRKTGVVRDIVTKEVILK